MLIAVVVYAGVLDDECQAFRSVLSLLHGAEVKMVGAEHGEYRGVGGAQRVDATFDEIDQAEVVIVPGGLGCEQAAHDPRLRTFLHRMERSARTIAASSTGTVVLAAAGLLHGEPAATHWLATDLLRRYGSEADPRRLVVTGNVITCEGRISAVEAAFALVERIEGAAAIEPIRARLIERGRPLLRPTSRWAVLTETLFGHRPGERTITGRPPRRRSTPSRPSPPTARAIPDRRHRAPDGALPDGAALDQPRVETGPAPVTPLSVMVELVDNDELRRQLKRRSGGRSGGRSRHRSRQ